MYHSGQGVLSLPNLKTYPSPPPPPIRLSYFMLALINPVYEFINPVYCTD